MPSLVHTVRGLLAYTIWADRQMLRCLEEVPQEDLSRETGTSHGSVLGTFAHLLGAEQVWLSRFLGVPLRRLPGVEDFPTLDLVRKERISPQTLGLFMGVPKTEALMTDQPLDLDRILLFKRNLEKICQDEEDLIDQIQVTVRHEVGHYLGLDEDDLERLGLA